jgi:hypothetical protein
VHAEKLATLEAELQLLRVSALQKRAAADGVEAEDMNAALDADDTKAALIRLVLERCAPEPAMSLGEAEAAVAAPEPEQDLEADDRVSSMALQAEKVAVLEAELQQLRASASRAGGAAAVGAIRKPATAIVKKSHHGVPGTLRASEKATKASSVSQQPATGLSARAPQLLRSRHAMLSYAWGAGHTTQHRVSRVRGALTQRGVECWMDIDGGMSGDIYDSMAQGVEKAAVIVPFLNADYQASENCMLVTTLQPFSFTIVGVVCT